MPKIIDPLDAKRKFVKKLTNEDEHVVNDDFLKPTTRKVVEKAADATIVEEPDKFQSEKKIFKNVPSKEEFEQLLQNVPSQREKKSGAEPGAVPDWAKLALSSLKTNTKKD
ncbi:hypothetical protein MUP77_17485 [Candidatus Bathyarchaeota archaeon]|nr:hypothetical protein [Candidatus Bathyarchaeota archaeon]